MKSDIAVLGIAVVAAFAGLSASGLTTNEWQAVNGVWDGNWSDKDHWTLGAVPTADQVVHFQAAAKTSYTVTVNDDYSVAVFELLGMDKGGDMTTTFKGSGSISASGNAVTRAYRALTLDGVDLSSDGTFSIYKDVIVTNGASVQAEVFQPYTATPNLYLYDGCSFKVTDVCKPRTSFNVYVYEGATAEVHDITRYSGNYIYPCYFHIEGGDVTVDTMRLWSAYSGATLNAGSFTLGNIDASYGNNGTFDFQGGTATLGAIPSGLVLPSDTFKIGSQATVKIPVGANYLLCKEGGLPATAKIVAVVPEGLAPAGYMVLRGWRDDTLPAALRESVTLEGAVEGAADGWALNTDAGGHVVAWKRGTVGASGTATCYEWTGAASEDFTDPNNWTDGDGVAPDYPHSTSIDVCFGASGVSTARILEGGTSANNFTFLSTAVNSFEFHATNAVNASGVTLQQYYLYSKSALPQHAFTTIRSRNATIGACADGAGALFITPPGNASYPNPLPFYTKNYAASVTPKIRGDVRLGGRTGKIENVCGITMLTKSGTAPFTRLTVVKGASLTYANTATTGFAVTDASIDVEEDATLTYANTQQPYQWTAAPSDFRINGTFDIQAPFVGGFDQTYGGSGVLKTAEIRPDASGNTSLNLRDTLVLEPSQDWVTANDAAPANTMRLAVTGGNPSIRLSNDWTYGPVEGTQTGPVDRSLVFNYGTTLTVDAGGHRATFKDYLTGRGTLIVTNGTTKLDYSDETRTNIRVCNTGVLEWTSANTLASLTVQPGGVLRPLAAVPLTFPSAQGTATATLTDSVLDVDRALVPATGWLTILRAEKGITGLPTLTDAGLVCRVRTVDGYAELQVKEKTGAILLFR